MLKRVCRVLRRTWLKLLYRLDSEEYKEQYPRYLRSLGVNIPEDYRKGGHGFIHPSVNLDGNDFSLITIGRNTTVSANVVILTHDYSITKGLQQQGRNCSARFLKPVIIGENSFIGMNSILLPGTTIGNNVVLGAGSVVHGQIEDNVVAAGNPARVLYSIEEWTQKHIDRKDFVVLQEHNR